MKPPYLPSINWCARTVGGSRDSVARQRGRGYMATRSKLYNARALRQEKRLSHPNSPFHDRCEVTKTTCPIQALWRPPTAAVPKGLCQQPDNGQPAQSRPKSKPFTIIGAASELLPPPSPPRITTTRTIRIARAAATDRFRRRFQASHRQ